jgi:hypothetical protein
MKALRFMTMTALYDADGCASLVDQRRRLGKAFAWKHVETAASNAASLPKAV